MRGSRTHGWGTSGQHRKGGMKGGSGKAGTFKHKWTSVLRYGGELEKRGFKSPRASRKGEAINVDDLAGLAETLKLDRDSTLNLTALGYSKLLGKGKVDRPIHVEVTEASELAVRKVTEAGGTVKVKEA
ncbi:MAG: uL15m family ribosomal protein [Candidatus Bathyarchaeia archaeon]